MTHSEEPSGMAEGGLRLPNETEYSFGDFFYGAKCSLLGPKATPPLRHTPDWLVSDIKV